MEDTKVLDKKKEKKPKTPKEITILVLKIVGNVLFYAILIMLFIISIANINSGGSKGLPNIFGKGFLSVQSNSMNADVTTVTSSVKSLDYRDSEITYLKEQGILSDDGTYTLDYTKFSIKKFSDHDLVVVSLLNAEQKKHLSIGDVITYYDQTEEKVISHRIVYLDVNDAGDITNYVTMGDYYVGNFEDVFSGNEWGRAHYEDSIGSQYKSISVESEYLYGKVTSVVAGGGDVADNIKANWLLYFVIPVAVVLLVEMFLVYRNFMIYRNEKKGITKDGKVVNNNQPIDLEAERERMKQELLAELRASQQQPQDETPEVKEETPLEEESGNDDSSVDSVLNDEEEYKDNNEENN